MKKLTCIICPRGCQLIVDENYNVSGNFCVRGAKYALEELRHPTRTLTTTISINSKERRVISCKSNKPLPKELIFSAMEIVNKTKVTAPIKIGDVLIKNILNTGIDIVATEEILN